MVKNSIQIRGYKQKDYTAIKKLYQDSGWFDPETDAEVRLKAQSEKGAQSILLAVNGDEIIGTATLLFTGRLGLFFRLITKDEKDAETRTLLLQKGEEIFRKNGYNEVHIIAPENDTQRQNEYEQYDFKTGRPYRWFWKKINHK